MRSQGFQGHDSIFEINWLLDVISPDQKATTSVIASFKKVVKDGELRLHPIITRLVDKDTLEKMGAKARSSHVQDDAQKDSEGV